MKGKILIWTILQICLSSNQLILSQSMQSGVQPSASDTQAFEHLDGRFRQVRESSMLSEPQVLTGYFAYDAPDKVVWQYDSGIEATLPAPILRLISATINGTYTTENEDFSMEMTADKLVLTPKKKRLQKIFDRVEIFLAPDGVAKQVLMHEPSGDLTTIFFTEMHKR